MANKVERIYTTVIMSRILRRIEEKEKRFSQINGGKTAQNTIIHMNHMYLRCCICRIVAIQPDATIYEWHALATYCCSIQITRIH